MQDMDQRWEPAVGAYTGERVLPLLCVTLIDFTKGGTSGKGVSG